LPTIVNVQLLVSLPPLEHAPDHTASRLPLTVNRIEVPLAKVAEAVLPTNTSMPAGVDVSRLPLRPVALTVRVTPAPGGLTDSEVVRVTPE
jgi:hypothetical protein